MARFANLKKGGLVGAAVIAIAMPFTAEHEGLRLKSYLDPVGIPTICYGETEGVSMGQVKSRAECDEMLAVRLAYFAWAVDQMITLDMPDKTHAALTSFTYNVGVDAFKKSTLRKLFNEGRKVEACNQLTKWKYAKGKILTGLVKRRELERRLCLDGLVEQGGRNT